MDTKTINKETAKPNTEEEIRQRLEELLRICAEAEQRFECGELLPALSSLAAIPPIHNVLVVQLETIEDQRTQNHKDPLGGLYL